MNPALYQWLTNISGVWLAIASALLFLIVLLGILGIKTEELWKGTYTKGWLVGLVVLVVVFILVVAVFGATPFGLPWWSYTFNSDLWTVVFFVIILAIVMWFLTRGGEKTEPATTSRSS